MRSPCPFTSPAAPMPPQEQTDVRILRLPSRPEADGFTQLRPSAATPYRRRRCCSSTAPQFADAHRSEYDRSRRRDAGPRGRINEGTAPRRLHRPTRDDLSNDFFATLLDYNGHLGKRHPDLSHRHFEWPRTARTGEVQWTGNPRSTSSRFQPLSCRALAEVLTPSSAARAGAASCALSFGRLAHSYGTANA